MTTLKITLDIEGKEKTFLNTNVTFRLYRKSLEFIKKFSNGDLDSLEAADALAEYVCMAFNHQFSYDELLDGLSVDGLQEKLWGIYRQVMESVDGESVEGEGELQADTGKQ